MGLRRITVPTWLWTATALVLVAAVLSPTPADARQYKTNARISVSTTGVQGINISNGVLSGGGGVAAFWTDRGAMVPEDTNIGNAGDVFVRLITDQNNPSVGGTVRVSLGFNGVQTARTDNNPAISYPDIDIDTSGCIIVYSSDAHNITAQNGAVVPDVNDTTDVFAVNRCISSFPNNSRQTLHVSKVYTGPTSGFQAAGGNTNPKISGNGRFVIWRSPANNLAFGDTNNAPDIFRMTLPAIDSGSWNSVNYTALTIERVNLSNTEVQANLEDGTNTFDISDNGNLVVFASVATNLVGGTDNNGAPDIYIRNISAGTTIRINGMGGALPNGASSNPVISGDGSYVAFRSNANNLVPGDTNGASDIFLYNLNSQAITRISVSSEGTQSNDGSDKPAINENGRLISFFSNANNLVFGDTNGAGDIFVYDRSLAITTRASVRSDGGQAAGVSGQSSSLNNTGTLLVFDSTASNIVSGDTNGSSDVFIGKRGPLSPNGLTASTLTQTSISLTWNDNATGEDGIVVQRRRPSESDFTDRQTLSPTATTFTDNTVSACKTYSYRVLSADDGIRSPSNIITVKTPGCPPGDFILRNPSNGDVIINPAAAEFRWEIATETVTYTFTLNRTGVGEVYTTTLDPVDVCDEPTNLCRLPAEGGLLAAMTNGGYTFTVSATNPIGTTQASNNPRTFSVDTNAQPRNFVLYAPANNSVIRSEGGLTGFTWQINPDATSYALNVIHVSNNVRLGSIINHASLTPASDGDGLTCASVCTYTPSGGELAALDVGTLTWIATAKSPGGTPREPSSGPFVFTYNTGDIEILANGGFEVDANADGVADGWTVSGITSDKRKCNTPGKIFTPYGECAFVSVGGANENSTIAQGVDFAWLGLVAGDQLQLNAFASQTSLPANAIRIILEVKYFGGLPKDKVTTSVPPGTSAPFNALSPINVEIDGSVKKITVKIISTATSGSARIDEVSLLLLGEDSPRRSLQYIPGTRTVTGGENEGTNAVLPPPPPPSLDGFRGGN